MKTTLRITQKIFSKTIVYWIFAFLIPVTTIGQAIMGTTGDGALAVVFPTPDNGLPNPTQMNVSGLPPNNEPHGVSYFGCNRALVSDFNNSRVFVVDVANATLISTINTAPNYNGTGTIAVAPSLSHALAIGFSSVLNVISTPFNSSSTITQITLPGGVQSYQTQAIVFDSNNRAYVYHSAGISVLDPPYTSVTFTIPVANNMSGAIAINAAGNKLLVTDLASAGINIFTAPFSAASTPQFLSIPAAAAPDGINITPDGNTALVVSALFARVFAVTAPFTSSSVVEQIPLPPLGGTVGFEDIGISSDGQLAILTGNSGFNQSDQLAAFIEAPFTASGAVAHAVTVNGPGRGAGAVRFVPPGLAISVSPSTLPDPTMGTPYQQTITASNGVAPFVFSISNGALPQGLSLDPATGVISGTPTISGTFSFTVAVTDAGGCSGSRGYAIDVAGPGCSGLFTDDFEDNIFDWNSVKPTWIETGGNLVGTPTGKKAVVLAPQTFAGCLNCKFRSVISVAGASGSKVWILSHFVDKRNTLEIQIKSTGKIKLLEKQNGSRVQKAKGFYEFLPNTSYTVDVEFDGTNIIVSIDGNPVITTPPIGNLQVGSIGFQSKRTSLSVAEVCVQ
ncbi:MAG TPA: putative Ig domain-containing protein [Acidobacteriota bacterium]|nr:putative Ig domain-containing protein [Acidobacteriota bacterium]